jgi:hypothetical protein
MGGNMDKNHNSNPEIKQPVRKETNHGMVQHAQMNHAMRDHAENIHQPKPAKYNMNGIAHDPRTEHAPHVDHTGHEKIFRERLRIKRLATFKNRRDGWQWWEMA